MWSPGRGVDSCGSLAQEGQDSSFLQRQEENVLQSSGVVHVENFQVPETHFPNDADAIGFCRGNESPAARSWADGDVLGMRTMLAWGGADLFPVPCQSQAIGNVRQSSGGVTVGQTLTFL